MLDSTIDVFNALVKGYNDYLIDMQALTAQTGYWCAYYQSKRPKKIGTIVKSILDRKLENLKETSNISDSDVQKFKERELRRMSTYNRWEV